jgi:hypothetical protein
VSKSNAQTLTNAALDGLKAASSEIRAKIEVLKPLQERLSSTQKEVSCIRSLDVLPSVLHQAASSGLLRLACVPPTHVPSPCPSNLPRTVTTRLVPSWQTVFAARWRGGVGRLPRGQPRVGHVAEPSCELLERRTASDTCRNI